MHTTMHEAMSLQSEPWLNGSASNPAIALEQSGLTVLDIDTGLGSTEQALDFAKRILLIDTMIVKSYRGYHFYFIGSRETNAKYKNGNVQGDLKSNGYVLSGLCNPSRLRQNIRGGQPRHCPSSSARHTDEVCGREKI